MTLNAEARDQRDDVTETLVLRDGNGHASCRSGKNRSTVLCSVALVEGIIAVHCGSASIRYGLRAFWFVPNNRVRDARYAVSIKRDHRLRCDLRSLYYGTRTGWELEHSDTKCELFCNRQTRRSRESTLSLLCGIGCRPCGVKPVMSHCENSTGW